MWVWEEATQVDRRNDDNNNNNLTRNSSSNLLFSGMSQPLVEREMWNDNSEIIAELQTSECDYTYDPGTLCIGGAAISITSSRENVVDFLPSYFGSGLQVR